MNVLRSLGPGLLYAGAAVGVSHLVQSTQAGARFGFDLIWVILLANFIKYPAFRFGPLYAERTGNSLLEGYRNIGPWALWLFLLMTILTMFIVEAAVTVVTAGLAYELLGISADQVPIWAMSASVLLITLILLRKGTYKRLDRIIKVIILSLTITTLFAVIVAAMGSGNRIEWGNGLEWAFVISFMGWMPAPLDLSVWHSIWKSARMKEENSNDARKSLLDFNTGYWGTVVLAILFLSLGALLLFDSGHEIPSGAVPFAKLLIDVYRNSLGEWSAPIIAFAAFTTMLSTTITCLDAFGRVMSTDLKNTESYKKTDLFSYRTWIVGTSLGAVLVIGFLMESMLDLIQFVTIVSFVAAPIIALLNHLAVFNRRSPLERQPSQLLTIWSISGIITLLIFNVLYFIHL